MHRLYARWRICWGCVTHTYAGPGSIFVFLFFLPIRIATIAVLLNGDHFYIYIFLLSIKKKGILRNMFMVVDNKNKICFALNEAQWRYKNEVNNSLFNFITG